MGVHFFQWQINITAIITAGGSDMVVVVVVAAYSIVVEYNKIF
jgi:hypothetical protein